MESKKNKKIILRFRAVNRSFFEAIKNGKKKVETRAATVKYKDIQQGDIVKFVCGKERFSRTVRSAEVFKSINALLKIHALNDIMPDAQSKKDLEEAYYSFPGYREKITKFGIMAITFKREK